MPRGGRRDRSSTELELAIVTLLTDLEEPIATGAIAEEVHLSVAATRNHLRELQAAGVVRCAGTCGRGRSNRLKRWTLG